MITTLESLQAKFADPGFKEQFEQDAQVSLPADVKSLGSNLLPIYYRALQKFLSDENHRSHRRYPMYVRIPFDEEPFAIDTETRVITVPQNFVQNGVGVVGDHLAEFLWFTVDRFYDMTDLMTCRIDILWHNTGVVGLDDNVFTTTPFAKYCDNEKIYFGWYISKNASLAAGSIEFAIRFYSQQEAQDGSVNIEFEMNTLPAKILIKNCISLDETFKKEDDFEDIVKSRAIYSEIINSLSAAEPVIIQNLSGNNDEAPGNKCDIDPELGYIDLTVGAFSPDNIILTQIKQDALGNDTEDTVRVMTKHKADIVYQWYRYDSLIAADGSNINFEGELADNIEPTIGYTIQPVIAPDDADDEYYDNDPEGEHVGESYSTLRTNIPGKYTVYIGNKIIEHEDDEELDSNYGAVRYLTSQTIWIEEAKQIELIQDNDPQYLYIEDVNHTLHAQVNWKTVNGACYYQWFRNGSPLSPDPVLCERNAAIEWVVTEPGIYYCEIKNVKNLMVTSVTTKFVTALHIPRKVENSDLTVSQVGNNLEIHVANGMNTSEYHYRITYAIGGTATYNQFNLGDDEYHIGDSHVINLLNRNLQYGVDYSIIVYVKEVTCRGISGYERTYKPLPGELVEASKLWSITLQQPTP